MDVQAYKGIVGERIKKLIGYSRITQVEVANALGVTKGTITHYIKGNSFPDLAQLKMLCRILDCSYEEILGSITEE